MVTIRKVGSGTDLYCLTADTKGGAFCISLIFISEYVNK